MGFYMLLALVSAVAMASSGVIARLSGLAAAELTFYRLAVGALCLLLLFLLRRCCLAAFTNPGVRHPSLSGAGNRYSGRLVAVCRAVKSVAGRRRAADYANRTDAGTAA